MAATCTRGHVAAEPFPCREQQRPLGEAGNRSPARPQVRPLRVVLLASLAGRPSRTQPSSDPRFMDALADSGTHLVM